MVEFIKVNYDNCDYINEELNHRLQELESIRFDLNLVNRRLLSTRFSANLFNCYKLLDECNDLISDFLSKFNKCINDVNTLDNDYSYRFRSEIRRNAFIKSKRIDLKFSGIMFKTKFCLLMKSIYGFTEDECLLLLKSYYLFKDSEIALDRRKFIHKYFSYICGLSFSYNGNHKSWLLTGGIPSYDKAFKYFRDLGLSNEEVCNLVIMLNMQHANYSEEDFLQYGIDLNKYSFSEYNYENHTSFANPNLLKDFAHEMVEIATFAYPACSTKFFVDLGSFGHANELSSYKGDVWSQSMPADDYRANIDAINIYNKLLNNPNKDMIKILVDYNSDVCDNSINRAEELYKYYGKGDIDKGRESVIDILDRWSPANELITNRAPLILDYIINSLSIDSMSGLFPNERYNERLNKYVMDNIDNLNNMKRIQEEIEFLKEYFINALDKELE